LTDILFLRRRTLFRGSSGGTTSAKEDHMPVFRRLRNPYARAVVLLLILPACNRARVATSLAVQSVRILDDCQSISTLIADGKRVPVDSEYLVSTAAQRRAMVPEFGDCQRLWNKTNQTAGTYGVLARIMPDANLAEIKWAAVNAAPIRVTEIGLGGTPAGSGYTDLYLTKEMNCAYLKKAKADPKNPLMNEKGVPATVEYVVAIASIDSGTCPTDLPGEAQEQLAVWFTRWPDEAVPAVARWDENDGRPYFGFMCEGGWCEALPQGLNPSTIYNPTGPKEQRIKAYYDEQHLVTKSGTTLNRMNGPARILPTALLVSGDKKACRFQHYATFSLTEAYGSFLPKGESSFELRRNKWYNLCLDPDKEWDWHVKQQGKPDVSGKLIQHDRPGVEMPNVVRWAWVEQRSGAAAAASARSLEFFMGGWVPCINGCCEVLDD
jgi:hypothetical protein